MIYLENYGEPIGFSMVSASITATLIPRSIQRPVTGTWANDYADAAFVSVEGNAVRCTFDGTDASPLSGHALYAGDSLMVRGRTAVQKFKFANKAKAAQATVCITTYTYL